MIRLPLFAGLLAFAATALPCVSAPAQIWGDYNDNDTVDAADYTIYRVNFGTDNLIPNDPTPHWVMEDDYDMWRANFGMTGGSASGAGPSAAPEPTGLCLTILSSLILYLCGHRSVRQRGRG